MDLISEVEAIAQAINDATNSETYLPGRAWPDTGGFAGATLPPIDGRPAGPPIDPVLTPEAYEQVSSGKRLLCCCVVSILASDDAYASGDPEGRTLYLRLGFYARNGYEEIRRAAAFVKGVLDPAREGTQMGPLADGRMFIVRYVNEALTRQIDPGIQSADVLGGGVCYEASAYRVETDWALVA